MGRLAAALMLLMLAALPLRGQDVEISDPEGLHIVPEEPAPTPVPLPLGEPIDMPLTTLEVPSPVVTVDQERLFADSAWGRRVLAEIESRSSTLADENELIERELIAEERALTDLRPEMEPEVFRARAEEFDTKVQALRAAQEAKRQDLSTFHETERQRFYDSVLDTLASVVADRGAVAILDRRAIVLSIADIDITGDAVARIDAEFGDGAAK